MNKKLQAKMRARLAKVKAEHVPLPPSDRPWADRIEPCFYRAFTKSDFPLKVQYPEDVEGLYTAMELLATDIVPVPLRILRRPLELLKWLKKRKAFSEEFQEFMEDFAGLLAAKKDGQPILLQESFYETLGCYLAEAGVTHHGPDDVAEILGGALRFHYEELEKSDPEEGEEGSQWD